MFFNLQMKRIRIVVLKRDADAVVEALGRLGVLELTSAPEEVREPADTVQIQESPRRCGEIKSRLESLADLLGVTRPELGAEEQPFRMSLDEVSALISTIELQILGPMRELRELTAQIKESQNAIQESLRTCSEIKSRLESLMDLLGIVRPDLGAEEQPFRMSLDEISALFSAIELQISGPMRELTELDAQSKESQNALDRIEPYKDLNVSPRRLARTSFLYVEIGDMPENQIHLARQELPPDAVLVALGATLHPGSGETTAASRKVVGLSSRRSRFALTTILEAHQFKSSELPKIEEGAPSAAYESASRKRDSLQTQVDALKDSLREIGQARRAEIRTAYRAINNELLITETKRKLASTWATVIITGWSPQEQTERIRQAVERVTGGVGIFQTAEADAEDIALGRVPSYSTQPAWLRPFQRLVNAFGHPAYGEIEPTLIFALSFLLMFGIVFGDLGQGLCLLVAGLLTHRLSQKPGTKDLGYLTAAAGLASALFGAFFQGSFFGRSLQHMGWPLTLGFEPLRMEGGDVAGHVVRYLLLALALGVALNSLGLILNVINRLRSRDYENLLLGRFGIPGVILYWGTLAMGIKLVVAGSGPHDLWVGLLVVVLPLVLLTLHEPIYALLTRHGRLRHENPLIGFFEGLIEALETVMLYVTNTFSFLRVAAFALSHAALCYTIFVLQQMVQRLPAGIIWSLLVLVVGTAIIIGLEGLIVAIQIFRLEYYEFFTKFFQGEGKKFSPFRLHQTEE